MKCNKHEYLSNEKTVEPGHSWRSEDWLRPNVRGPQEESEYSGEPVEEAMQTGAPYESTWGSLRCENEKASSAVLSGSRL